MPGIAGQFTFTNGPSRQGERLMDETRQDFFARAAFAQNQNRNVQAGGALDLLPDRLHRFGRTEVNMVRRQLGRMDGSFGF